MNLGQACRPCRGYRTTLIVSRSGPRAPTATPAPGMCARSGGIDNVSQPASVAPAVTTEPSTRLKSSEIDIVSLPASGLPASIPALGTRSQSGGIGITSWSASASARTCASASVLGNHCIVKTHVAVGMFQRQGPNSKSCYTTQITE